MIEHPKFLQLLSTDAEYLFIMYPFLRHERYRWMMCLFLGGVGLYASRAVLPISSVALSVELHWNRQAAVITNCN